MSTRRPAAPQSDAVSRRLSLLSAELAAVRQGATADADIAAEPHTRIRALSAVPDADHEDGDPGPALPVPGRHASRPVGAGVGAGVARQLAERMPDTMRGRVRLTAPQVTLVAVVTALGVALAAWWTLRSGSPGDPLPPAGPRAGASVVQGLETPPASPEPAPAAVATTVVVDVAGAVRRPGIVVLESGSRVVDAIKAAGGPRKSVDLGGLNQARLLVDGEQIVVGATSPPGLASSAAPSGAAPTTALVNINTATGEQLEELPGVGPVTAQAIIDWRSANGGFTSVEELLEVDGIGDATLADVAPYVTI